MITNRVQYVRSVVVVDVGYGFNNAQRYFVKLVYHRKIPSTRNTYVYVKEAIIPSIREIMNM